MPMALWGMATGMKRQGDEEATTLQDEQASSREGGDYVGRAGGDDGGYEKETGAERRAEEEDRAETPSSRR